MIFNVQVMFFFCGLFNDTFIMKTIHCYCHHIIIRHGKNLNIEISLFSGPIWVGVYFYLMMEMEHVSEMLRFL